MGMKEQTREDLLAILIVALCGAGREDEGRCGEPGVCVGSEEFKADTPYHLAQCI